MNSSQNFKPGTISQPFFGDVTTFRALISFFFQSNSQVEVAWFFCGFSTSLGTLPFFVQDSAHCVVPQ
jgi:hypothetical protein